jgi:hypothetical protein
LTFCWTKGKTGVAAFNFLLFGFYCGFCKTLFQYEYKKREEKKKNTAFSTLLFCAFVKKKKKKKKRCESTTPRYHSNIVAFQSIKTSSAQILSVSG